MSELPQLTAVSLTVNTSLDLSQASNLPPTRCKRHQTSLSCFCFNARSTVNKRLNLQTVLEDEHHDIIAVTEIFLRRKYSWLSNKPFAVFRWDRNRQGGGLMLMNIPAMRQNDLETNCELIWIELTATSIPRIIGFYYWPQNHNTFSLDALIVVR